VEQMLTAMWIDHKATNWRVPTPKHPEFTQWRSRVFVLRARMLAFVQQILAFATVEVLEPNWRKLEAKLGKVTTVDQLLRDHVDFLDTCLKECMLTSSKLLRVCLSNLSERLKFDDFLIGIFQDARHVFYVRLVFGPFYKVCQPRGDGPRSGRWRSVFCTDAEKVRIGATFIGIQQN
jgi:Gamma tubulin complex component C-terminal